MVVVGALAVFGMVVSVSVLRAAMRETAEDEEYLGLVNAYGGKRGMGQRTIEEKVRGTRWVRGQ